jgi:hypothetical protein
VTIAAAMRCADGVILCSDSLISGGDVNDSQAKIVPFNVPALNMNVAVAFAGTVAHCWCAIRNVAQELNSLPPSSNSSASALFSSTLTEVLVEYHKKHIFPHPLFRYMGGPSIELIAVLQDQDTRQVTIFSSNETAVNPQGQYAFVGVGAAFAKHIVDPLICLSLSSMPRNKVLLLADHMLHQVKLSVPGCGDSSQFFYVGNDIGFCRPAHQPLLPEERSSTFQRIVSDLFYASADLDLDDDLVNIGLHLTDKRIIQIREEQRSERERRRKLGPATFDFPLLGIGPTVDKYKPKHLDNDQRKS